MSSNPRGVVGGEIVGRSEGWSHPSTPIVLAVGELLYTNIMLHVTLFKLYNFEI